jgi:hypothetical protein
MKLQTSSAWQYAAVMLLLGSAAHASLGDRLPEFKHCLEVRSNKRTASDALLTSRIDMQGSQLRREPYTDS